ncbi:MAG: hypothetical protein KJO79_08675 [Verrucomicrobiae bacterium]|nr:hypothetical protein [Verrucomicrobiae bacterium]NNJ87240.1 hypothetical protein [Akkermansiaceae bacterium]
MTQPISRAMMIKILNKPTFTVVSAALLCCLTVNAGKEMAREPRPGEKIEKTKRSDAEIKKLLTGKWFHEHTIKDTYTLKCTYAFREDGGYTMHQVDRVHFPRTIRKSDQKGEWTVRDGILTLTPTDPKGKKPSLHGRFTAYTIMKISASELVWQINWEHSDASPAVKRTLTITTYKRMK